MSSACAQLNNLQLRSISDPKIPAARMIKDYKAGSKVLIVSMGFHETFFKLPPELQKEHNLLSLRDPYGFLFYKGFDGTGTQSDLEELIKGEIDLLKPEKVIFTALCVNGVYAMVLGIKFQVDEVITFSPWTHINEEISTVSDSISLKNSLIHRTIKQEYDTNPFFREVFLPTYDLNRWKDQIGKTKITIFFNDSTFDKESYSHLDEDTKKKINIIHLKGIDNTRDTIKAAINH